jgi:hypothetical protein
MGKIATVGFAHSVSESPMAQPEGETTHNDSYFRCRARPPLELAAG